MKHEQIIVSVFGSSRVPQGSAEYQTAYSVGKLLAEAGCAVCNGGYGGTMEASARGAKEAGGKTIGVVTEVFSVEANPFIDEKIVTKSLIERLMKLIELGDAYIVLRGGTGTLLELAAVWEHINKRLIAEKPIITVGTFWSGVITTMKEELAWEGKVDASKHVTEASSPSEGVRLLQEKLRQMKGRM